MSDTPFISVIIPTYNRKQSLLRLLNSLAIQTFSSSEYEVVVSDDGSLDGTSEMIRHLALPYPIVYTWQKNARLSAARDLGLSKSQGEIVLFLDDDMEADCKLIEEHVSVHERFQLAVVRGQVVVRYNEPATVYSRIHDGWTEMPKDVRSIEAISFQKINGGHFSIPRSAALAIGGWYADWTMYGFEDLEFMSRCWQADMKMLYNPRAITFHHDHIKTLAQSCGRAESAAMAAAIELFSRHPELEGQIPMFRDKGYVSWREDNPQIILRKLARGVMIWSPALRGLEKLVSFVERICPKPALLKPLYRWVIGSYICLGYREGQRSVQHG